MTDTMFCCHIYEASVLVFIEYIWLIQTSSEKYFFCSVIIYIYDSRSKKWKRWFDSIFMFKWKSYIGIGWKIIYMYIWISIGICLVYIKTEESSNYQYKHQRNKFYPEKPMFPTTRKKYRE